MKRTNQPPIKKGISDFHFTVRIVPWKIDIMPMTYPDNTRIGAIVKAMKPRPYSPLSNFMVKNPMAIKAKLSMRNS